MHEKLEQQENKSDDDNKKLDLLKLQLEIIEKWAETKMEAKLHWTKEEILLNYGNTPTLIITFHLGSVGYKTYGKEIVVNINFNDEELLELFANIHDKGDRKAGTVSFDKVPEMTNGEFSTYDIFEIAGRNIN